MSIFKGTFFRVPVTLVLIVSFVGMPVFGPLAAGASLVLVHPSIAYAQAAPIPCEKQKPPNCINNNANPPAASVAADKTVDPKCKTGTNINPDGKTCGNALPAEDPNAPDATQAAPPPPDQPPAPQDQPPLTPTQVKDQLAQEQAAALVAPDQTALDTVNKKIQDLKQLDKINTEQALQNIAADATAEQRAAAATKAEQLNQQEAALTRDLRQLEQTSTLQPSAQPSETQQTNVPGTQLTNGSTGFGSQNAANATENNNPKQPSLMQAALETAAGAVETVAEKAQQALTSAWDTAKEVAGNLAETAKNFSNYLASKLTPDGGNPTPLDTSTAVAGPGAPLAKGTFYDTFGNAYDSADAARAADEKMLRQSEIANSPAAQAELERSLAAQREIIGINDGTTGAGPVAKGLVKEYNAALQADPALKEAGFTTFTNKEAASFGEEAIQKRLDAAQDTAQDASAFIAENCPGGKCTGDTRTQAIALQNAAKEAASQAGQLVDATRSNFPSSQIQTVAELQQRLSEGAQAPGLLPGSEAAQKTEALQAKLDALAEATKGMTAQQKLDYVGPNSQLMADLINEYNDICAASKCLVAGTGTYFPTAKEAVAFDKSLTDVGTEFQAAQKFAYEAQADVIKEQIATRQQQLDEWTKAAQADAAATVVPKPGENRPEPAPHATVPSPLGDGTSWTSRQVAQEQITALQDAQQALRDGKLDQYKSAMDYVAQLDKSQAQLNTAETARIKEALQTQGVMPGQGMYNGPQSTGQGEQLSRAQLEAAATAAAQRLGAPDLLPKSGDSLADLAQKAQVAQEGVKAADGLIKNNQGFFGVVDEKGNTALLLIEFEVLDQTNPKASLQHRHH